MAADATAQLIQRIKSQLSPDEVTLYENSTNFLGTLDNIVGIAANYAQILSLAIPASAGDAVAAAAASSALAGGSGTAVAAAAAGAASAGVGAVVVLFVAAVAGVLGALLGSSGQPDPDAADFETLITKLTDTLNVTLANYYSGKLTNAQNYWTNLYTDLNNLQLQGTGGPQVTGPDNQNQFIQDAQRMVNNLLTFGSGYWERPSIMELEFAAQPVRYGYGFFKEPGTSPGWYGKMPLPQVRWSEITPDTQIISDPNTLLPLAVWAIQAYLTIMEVTHEADPGEPGNTADPGQLTFQKFVQEYGATDLAGYASFLYNQFTLAVGAKNAADTDPPPYGLVKTDVPTFEDVLNLIWCMVPDLPLTYDWPPPPAGTSNFPHPPGILVPSPFWLANSTLWGLKGEGDAPAAGYGWNGVYGVADQFAPYPSPVAVPSTGPSCIVDLINTDAMQDLFTVVPGPESNFDYQGWLQYHVQYFWTYPWLKTRLTLALMARWKALYLFHGHSATWAVIQHLDALASKPPRAVPRLPDGTMASGDWSVRELFRIVGQDGPLSSGATELSSSDGTGYSLIKLVEVLDVLAKGSWGAWGNTSLSMPASVRDRLAAAALV